VIGDDIRALIGTETETFLGEITLRDIQRYAIAVGDLNPLYFDEEYARRSAYGGIIAPPNFLTGMIGWTAGPPEPELSPDGLSPDPIRPLLRGVQRAMGAGQELEFGAPVRPGDRITRSSRITGVEERAGRSGPLVMITFEERYVNQDGRLVVTCRSRVIVR
jgi:acyl dehydratase